MMKNTAGLVAILCLVACRTPMNEQETGLLSRNGEKVSDPAYYSVLQFDVAGLRPDSDKLPGSCSATLLCERLLLTAAHCFRDPAYEVVNYLTLHYSDEKIQRSYFMKTLAKEGFVEGKDFIFHPEAFDENGRLNYAHDLAVVHLDKAPAQFAAINYIGLNPVPLTKGETYDGLGYGMTEEGSEDGFEVRDLFKKRERTYHPSLLRKATMRYVGQHVNDPLNPNAPGPFIHLVPAEKNQMVCPGDSGGPLLASPGEGKPAQLVGVLSQITLGRVATLYSNSCVGATSAYYVDVAAHRDWIEQQVADFCPRAALR